MKNKKIIFIGLGLVGLACVGGLAELLYLNKVEKSCERGENWRKREMVVGKTVLSERDKKELQDRVKAMTAYEIEVMLEVIPVEACMKRISQELNHAREFESMIKKAYDMK